MDVESGKAVAALIVALLFFGAVSYEYLRVSDLLLRHLREHHREPWQHIQSHDTPYRRIRYRTGPGRFIRFVFSNEYLELKDDVLGRYVGMMRLMCVLSPLAWTFLIAALFLFARSVS